MSSVDQAGQTLADYVEKGSSALKAAVLESVIDSLHDRSSNRPGFRSRQYPSRRGHKKIAPYGIVEGYEWPTFW